MSTAAPPPLSGLSWAAVGQVTLSVLSTVGYALGKALYWIGSYLVVALAWLFKSLVAAASWPVLRLLRFLSIVFSPVTYTLALAPTPVISFIRFLGQFEALYIYLGSAAFIGVVTGLVIKLTSSYFVAALQISPQDEKRARAERYRALQARQTRPSTSSTSGGPATPRDDVWLWLEEFNPAKSPTSKPTMQRQSPKHKGKPRGLLSMTIMEESSTDD